MTTEAVVLDATGYAAKLAELGNIFVDPATNKPLPYAEVGQSLYESNGCGQCHSIDGSPGIGPTWLGLYKSDVAFSVAPPGYTLSAGDSDAKWDAYLRESHPRPRRDDRQGLSERHAALCRPVQRQPVQRQEAGGHRRISSRACGSKDGAGRQDKVYRPMTTA